MTLLLKILEFIHFFLRYTPSEFTRVDKKNKIFYNFFNNNNLNINEGGNTTKNITLFLQIVVFLLLANETPSKKKFQNQLAVLKCCYKIVNMAALTN